MGGCRAELLEEYVTGAVLDALESPRVQEALHAEDSDAAHREELLATIQRAQDVRAEYDRLAGSATVLGDIPPSDGVREAWESWNTDRRRAITPKSYQQATRCDCLANCLCLTLARVCT